MAKQKQEVARKQLEREKERLEEEQALQLEELEEENRRKLAEAKLDELELTDLKRPTNFMKLCLRLVDTRSKQRPRECLTGLMKSMNLIVFQINRRPIQLI